MAGIKHRVGGRPPHMGKLAERLGTYPSVEWCTSLFFNLECKQLIASVIQIGTDRWIVGQARGNLVVGTDSFRLVVRVRAARPTKRFFIQSSCSTMTASVLKIIGQFVNVRM